MTPWRSLTLWRRLTPIKVPITGTPPFPRDPGVPVVPKPSSDPPHQHREAPRRVFPQHPTMLEPKTPHSPFLIPPRGRGGSSVPQFPPACPQPAARHRPGYSWWPAGPQHPQLWQAGQNPVITGNDSPGYFQPLKAGRANCLIGLWAASATPLLGGGTGYPGGSQK